jgi:cytidine deaminase
MTSDRASVDWTALRRRALEAAAGAYAPYSGLRVGAAGIDDRGRLVTGCNVENASYGLTLCAECGLVSALRAGGGTRLVAVAVCAGDGAPLTPCGRCRQLLYELGGPGLMIDDGPDHPPLTVADLLPGAFGPEDLRRSER